MSPTVTPNIDTKDARMAWFRESEIRQSIRTCEKIFNSGIFNPQHLGNPLFQSAVVHLLICLNDLLAKANQDGKRVSFTQDIKTCAEINDITALVAKCRNAACHISSPLNNLETNRFAFNCAAGKDPGAFQINGVSIGCDFEDDIAVYYGTYRLYLRRNALVALQEVIARYPEKDRSNFHG